MSIERRGSYGHLMAQLGADDVEVDRLASTFDRTATRLTTIEESITTSVRTIAWHGPDADVFRGKWNNGMKAQLTTVSQRLGVIARDLRKQAEAQRTASEGGDIAINAPRYETPEERALRELWEARAELARRLAEAEDWAENEGRQQIRDLADKSEQAQLDWWRSLTDDQRAAILRTDPGALFGLDGLPADLRAEARERYLDSIRGDLEISSTEDSLAGELNIAWVHLGVEGRAGITQLADGTYRVDLSLDGEIGAKVGSGNAEGHVGLGAGVSQSYSFDSLEEAEAFVDGLYEKLTPDIDLGLFQGPGGVAADTVEDVVDYLGDHSEYRRSFEGELRVEGEAELKLGSFDVNVSGEAGGRYDFDTGDRTLFVGGSFDATLAAPSVAPIDGAGETSSVGASVDVEAAITYDENGNVSELSLSGTVGVDGSIGLEQFFGGTNAASKTPEQVNMTINGGAEVSFDAKLDLQDPIVQRYAADVLNSLGNGDISLEQLQELLGEAELQVQLDSTTSSSDKWDIGVASLEVSTSNSENITTWVRPPGGDFTNVSRDELEEDRR